jgi:hypothetical protein
MKHMKHQLDAVIGNAQLEAGLARAYYAFGYALVAQGDRISAVDAFLKRFS